MTSIGADVSIVIPTYNYRKYLRDCLEGALSQTIPPKEILVVDDGSEDNTREVVQEFLPNVRYIWQANMGLSAARNKGAMCTTGEWLLFCDADDILVPTALVSLLANSQKNNVGVVYGRVDNFYPDGKPPFTSGSDRCKGFPPYPAWANFPKSAVPTSGAAIIRRKAYETVGGYEMPWTPTEDRDFWMKVGMYFSFEYTSNIVLRKRYHKDSAISKRDRSVYWAMLVQLMFIEWCRERGLDYSFLEVTPKSIMERAMAKSASLLLPRAMIDIKRIAKQRGIPIQGAWGALVRTGLGACKGRLVRLFFAG